MLQIMILASASYKGGVGKSTVTAALALAAEGRRVLVGDLDKNQTCKEWSLGCELPENLKVEVVRDSEVPAFVHEQAASSDYDDILLDLMGAREERHLVAYALADLVIVPSQVSRPDLKCAMAVRADIKRMEQELGMEIPFRLLITMLEKKETRVSRAGLGQVQDSAIPMFRTMIGDRTAYKEVLFCGDLPDSESGRAARAEVDHLLKEIRGIVEYDRWAEELRAVG